MTDQDLTSQEQVNKSIGMCRLHGLHNTEATLRALSAALAAEKARADLCTPTDERVKALIDAIARGPIANEDMQGWIKTQMKAAQALRDMDATP